MVMMLKTAIFEESSISIENIILKLRVNTLDNNTNESRNISKLLKSSSLKNNTERKLFRKKNRRKNPKILKPKSDPGFPFDEDCFFNSLPIVRPSSNEEDLDILNSMEGRNFKTILSFVHAYQSDYYWGFGHKVFEDGCCKEKRCFFTNQRNKIPLDEFDAVLIHFKGLSSPNALPNKRKSHQRWIFYDREPPWLSGKNIESYEGLFNWTMTYRTDTDITAGYGKVYSKSKFPKRDFSKFTKNSTSLEELLNTKKKPVAILVSHCNVPSQREEYIKMLQKYLQVDVYGGCGPLKCDRSKGDECYKMIENNYKFYLSFENSLCTDYITEKFFIILGYNIVPVVRGPEDYSSFAPPHSYIDARKFNVSELATFLRYLDGNNTAYLEYFKWKKSYFTYTDWTYHVGSLCNLCYKLHNDPQEKIYNNLKEWFYGKSKCYP